MHFKCVYLNMFTDITTVLSDQWKNTGSGANKTYWCTLHRLVVSYIIFKTKTFSKSWFGFFFIFRFSIQMECEDGFTKSNRILKNNNSVEGRGRDPSYYKNFHAIKRALFESKISVIWIVFFSDLDCWTNRKQ